MKERSPRQCHRCSGLNHKLQTNTSVIAWHWHSSHFQPHVANAHLTSPLECHTGSSDSTCPKRRLHLHLSPSPGMAQATIGWQEPLTCHLAHSASPSVCHLSPDPLCFTSQVLSTHELLSFSNSTLLFLAGNMYFPDFCEGPQAFLVIPTLTSPQSTLLQNENYRIPLKLINSLIVIIIGETIMIKQLMFLELLSGSDQSKDNKAPRSFLSPSPKVPSYPRMALGRKQ